MLCQTTCSMLIRVEPNLVVGTLVCPKFIVFDLCSHIIYSVQGKWLVLNFSLFGGFTQGNILDIGGAAAPQTPGSYAPADKIIWLASVLNNEVLCTY